MLLRSKDNLYNKTTNFIDDNNEITVFSAYIQTSQLKKLNINNKINRVIVRWEIKDICLGVSDLELYEYCQENKISFYRNTRLHMKTFWDYNDKVLIGSANLTGKGIGESKNCNFELNIIKEGISNFDRLYLEKVISESEYVTEDLYKSLKKIKEETEMPVINFPKLETKKSEKDYFLLSQLPMYDKIDNIWNDYQSFNTLNSFDCNCLSHDLNLYKIPLNLSEEEFQNSLKMNFNGHPFIIEFKNLIKNSNRKSLGYGQVVSWIIDKTTTVPTPRSWELKKEKIVNILYDWVCYFDDSYRWSRPSHSQVIFYDPK
jgi:hypothetical protein